MRFNKIPDLTISDIFILPLPNTIAFGGVATGIIKAQDADIVAGIIMRSGFIFIAILTEARIGRIISVVAVFEVSSVKKVIERHIVRITKIGLTSDNATNLVPIKGDNPLT